MQEYQKILGDAVLSARKSQKVTQEELSARLGIDPRTLTAIENYRGNIQRNQKRIKIELR